MRKERELTLVFSSHELYIYANTLDMFKNFVPKFRGRYLSSNVNITIADQHGKPVSVPVGGKSKLVSLAASLLTIIADRFAKFRTRKGRSVTALGVLYDFTGNDVNTTVQKVEDMVKESWFHEAIKEEPDFFLLAG